MSPPRRARRVGKPTRRARRSREALPELREGLGGPPKGLRGIARLSRAAGRCRKAHGNTEI